MTKTRRSRVTLAALLAILQPEDYIFVVRRLGPHECESVADGTVQELQSARCVEVCGDNVVEHLALDVDDWPDPPVPTHVITIGEKAEEWGKL